MKPIVRQRETWLRLLLILLILLSLALLFFLPGGGMPMAGMWFMWFWLILLLSLLATWLLLGTPPSEGPMCRTCGTTTEGP